MGELSPTCIWWKVSDKPIEETADTHDSAAVVWSQRLSAQALVCGSTIAWRSVSPHFKKGRQPEPSMPARKEQKFNYGVIFQTTPQPGMVPEL